MPTRVTEVPDLGARHYSRLRRYRIQERFERLIKGERLISKVANAARYQGMSVAPVLNRHGRMYTRLLDIDGVRCLLKQAGELSASGGRPIRGCAMLLFTRASLEWADIVISNLDAGRRFRNVKLIVPMKDLRDGPFADQQVERAWWHVYAEGQSLRSHPSELDPAPYRYAWHLLRDVAFQKEGATKDATQ